MTKRVKTSKHSETTLEIPMPRWVGGSFLELVQEFNDRYLESLMRLAEKGDTGSLPDIPRRHGRLWTSIDTHARRRASLCPVILADFRFRNVIWWRNAADGKDANHQNIGRSGVARIDEMEMARNALTVAWLTAREDLCLATLLIGMSVEVAEIVAGFTLHGLWQLADQSHGCLRPRYEKRAVFWGRLLRAAARDDRTMLHDIHLHAILLADTEHGGRASTHV